MNPAKAICLLNAKVSDPGRIPGTGVAEITPSMVCLACGGLAKKYMVAFTAKWAGELTKADLTSLSEALLWDISKIAGDWTYKKGTILKMCELAVKELHDPKKYRSDVSKAREIGVCRQTFAKQYTSYYNQIYSLVDDYTNVAFRHIKNKLK